MFTRSAAVSTPISPTTTAEEVWQREAQNTAEKQNTKSSTHAEGYLALTRAHIQNNELLAAQNIFKQELLSGVENDAQRIQLEKEIQEVSATIIRLNQLLHLVPNEIWESVFGYLNYQDLQQCTEALNSWCNIILKMLGLWDAWESSLLSDRSSQYAIHYQSPTTIRIVSPMNPNLREECDWWFKKLFSMSRCWPSDSFQTLIFADMTIADSISDYISEMLQSVRPPFDEVIFQPSTTITTYAFRRILASCSRTKSLTISSTLARSLEPVNLNVVELSSLTYLKLAFYCHHVSFTHPALRDVVCQCPNLTHLVLFFARRKYHETYIRQAIEYCSHLKTLAIGRGTGSGPDGWQTVAFDDDCLRADDISNSKSSTLQKLDTLKFSSSGAIADNFSFIIDKTCMSLRYLYFSCSYYAFEHDHFRVLADGSLPNLRKVQFQLCKKTHYLPPASILHNLTVFFSKAVSLEEIILDFGYCIHPTDPEQAANDLLLAIARKCRLLRRLAIVRGFRYTGDTMFEFASAVGPGFTHLEICMDQSSAPAFVQNLATLVYFKFSDISHSYHHRNNPSHYGQATVSCINTIEDILQQRRGGLSILS